jgi:hypothetical protein
MALSVGIRTFRLAGKPGWFIHMRDVVRPQGDSPAFSIAMQEVPEAQRMSVVDLAAVVKDSVKKFAHPIPVHILDDASTLHLIEPIDPATDIAKGVTVNGKIYLFRNGITGPDGACETLFHKMLHLGLRRFMTRSQYVTTMAEAYRTAPA